MKSWLIGLTLVIGMTAQAQMDHSMGSASMLALEASSGKTFDIHWMSQMIEHHQGALEMAGAEIANGQNANVKKAAQAILKAQSSEIKTLTVWLQRWYNTKPVATQRALMRSDMQPMLDGMKPMAGMRMNVDKLFPQSMIPHHQSAVEMGKLAMKKAFKPELKKFAQNVINVQTLEIKQYQNWLKASK